MGNTKLILICSEFPPFAAGIGNYVLRLAEGMTRRGHSVGIITRRHKHTKDEEYLPNGILLLRVKHSRLFPFGNMLFDKHASRAIEARFNDFDLVNIHYPAPIIIRSSRPMVLTIHNVIASNRERLIMGAGIPSTVRLLFPILKLYERKTIRYYSIITSVSETVAFQTICSHQISSTNIDSIGNGVNTTEFHPINQQERKNYILYTGRLDRAKRIDTLILAFRQISKEYPDMQLKIVGDGPVRKSLQSLVYALGISRSVEFMGWRSGQEYLEIIKTANIFVMPSAGEGLSTSILEAMSCGIATIATNIPNNAEIINHGINGLLFEIGDQSSLETCIKHLIENPDYKSRIEREARATIVKKYNWSDVLTRFEKKMISILNDV